MSSKSALAQQLAIVAGFEDPTATLEQYRTPPELAAHLVHTADLNGDVEGRLVVDLGCGTGMLALGAALRGPSEVVGLDLDPAPLATARENERKVASTTAIEWVRADATQAPLCPAGETTVLMNPPFGAQAGNEHADRRFLETAAAIADVSYSIHNEGSEDFVASFAATRSRPTSSCRGSSTTTRTNAGRSRRKCFESSGRADANYRVTPRSFRQSSRGSRRVSRTPRARSG